MPDLRKGKQTKADVSTSACVVCGETPSRPAQVFPSLGDQRENIVPLCKTHFREQYHVGWLHLIELYPNAAHFLQRLGWVYDKTGFKNKQ